MAFSVQAFCIFFFAKDVYLAENFQIVYLQKFLGKAKKIAKSLDNGGGGYHIIKM